MQKDFQKEYKCNFQVVKKAIDTHDPYGLLFLGCPADEYDIESRDIVSKIKKDSSADEIASICSEVFTHWFDEDFPKEKFIKVAQEISLNLTANHRV